MKKNLIYLAVIGLGAFMASCRPYQEEKYVEVSPNETAYVIPLENGTNNQSKLKSEAYLEQNKVAAKRIYTPTQWHSTGRMWCDGDWIPSVRVIKVDRTPVTREWNDTGRGTSANNDEAIRVESKESIGFSVCITATASIPEESATHFLYSYSGKNLAQVMDNDVRGYIQNILTKEFGSRDLTSCQNDRGAVFDAMRKDVTEHFSKFGIKIVNIGSAGQFVYTDKSIQAAINSKYSSEMKIAAAKNEVESAKKFAEAKNAIEAQKNLDAEINIKNAIADGIRNGRIPVPQVVAGSNISIMDLYGLKSMSSNPSVSKRRK